jgi:hypothetical protein
MDKVAGIPFFAFVDFGGLLIGLFKVIADFSTDGRIADNDEIPWLREPDGRLLASPPFSAATQFIYISHFIRKLTTQIQ